MILLLRPPLMYLNKLRFLKIQTNLLHLHALTLFQQIDIFKIFGLNFRDTAADVLQMLASKIMPQLWSCVLSEVREPLYIGVIASNDSSLIIFNTQPRHCTIGKKGEPDRHQVEAHFKPFLGNFKGFRGVNWTKRHLEACKPPGDTSGRPLQPLKLLSNLPRDVVGDDRLGSHSAL